MARKSKKSNPLLFIILIIAAVCYFGGGEQLLPSTGGEDYSVEVHFIDVGQGDSIFAELPDGKCMLIDAGEKEYAGTVASYIKNQKYSSVDFVVATHPHSDHIGGMSYVLDNFDIGTFYMPDCINNTSTFERMLTSLENKGIDTRVAEAGVEIYNNNGCKIEILSPVESYDDLNDWSAVVKLTYGDVSYLFMGDCEQNAENLIKGDVSSTVLKVGHHGSTSSTGIDFLKRVHPEVAVVSVGADNEYGHPHSKVITRLEKSGATVLRTDMDGTVVVGTDGKNIYY